MQSNSRTRKKALAAWMLGSALLLCTAAANAAVVYRFTADSSYSGPTGSFTYTAPTFVSAPIYIPSTDVDTCTSSEGQCGYRQAFLSFSGYATLGFMPTDLDMIYYYFNPGTFSQYGTFETVIFGSDQHGTLTISASDVADVPEPASIALAAIALGGIAAARRRRAKP